MVGPDKSCLIPPTCLIFNDGVCSLIFFMLFSIDKKKKSDISDIQYKYTAIISLPTVGTEYCIHSLHLPIPCFYSVPNSPIVVDENKK